MAMHPYRMPHSAQPTLPLEPDAEKRPSLTVRQPVVGRIDRAHLGEDVTFPKPGELIEIWERTPLTLADRRTFNILLAHAWPSILERDKNHSIATVALKGDHNGNERLRETIARLMSAIVVVKLQADGNQAPTEQLVQLLGPSKVPKGEGVVHYRFMPELVEILARSRHWARLQAQIMLSLSSKYSLALYEWLAKRENLRITKQVVSLEDMRLILGVQQGKMERWPDFRRFALEPAVSDVNRLGPVWISIQPVKRGNAVSALEVVWSRKDEEGLQQAARELASHVSSRRERSQTAVAPPVIGPVIDLFGESTT